MREKEREITRGRLHEQVLKVKYSNHRTLTSLTTADTDENAINKMTTKQGQDKSLLYSVALEY